MEFWFSELHSPHVKFDIRVEKQLFSGESDYQRIPLILPLTAQAAVISP